MQIPVIKHLVENHTSDELEQAEFCLMEEKELPMKVDGQDDGEILTHLIAAGWIIEKMEKDDIPFPKALRAYTEKVRTSISS
ncbi:MAG: hypothetical protein ABJF11_14345 [Reichenbachiella sp.]|uniref:DUF6952 family protein n=1 Tax=Reichenbachiella sp. TaxID=2184521 RepID=UPI003264A5B8